MDASDPCSKIDYPKQTSEWGRSLIDVLNTHFNQFQQRTFFEDMSTFFLHDILRALQILLTVRLSGYV